VINGLGEVQSLMIVGGTSDIGLATVTKIASRNRLRRVVLVGRNLELAKKFVSSLIQDAVVDSVEIDLCDVGEIELRIREVWNDGIDVAVMTAGFLPPPTDSPFDSSVVINAAMVNYVSQVAIGSVVVDLMLQQGFGTVAVVSSVAVERPRKDNFVYGSSKVGLDAWALGLFDYLHGLPIRVFVVRPGMVRTKMTIRLPEVPMAVEKEAVAEAIYQNLVHGPPVVWVPRRLRWVFMLLRHLPRWAFRRLNPGGGKSPAGS
jgi:decaprenylphospho-beta-D-erythro-pentofuranosid-2-ulose 2-reductase